LITIYIKLVANVASNKFIVMCLNISVTVSISGNDDTFSTYGEYIE